MKTILIVDDSPTIREQLKSHISKNYNAIACSSPIQALEFLDTITPDLIISDLHMPLMSGLEFIKNVKKRRSFIPCILLTSDERDNMITLAKSAGVASVIKKPYTERHLMLLLKMILGD